MSMLIWTNSLLAVQLLGVPATEAPNIEAELKRVAAQVRFVASLRVLGVGDPRCVGDTLSLS